MGVREDAKRIWQAAISAVQPDSAVRRALETASLTGNIHLVAIGKAAWSMANAAFEALGNAILDGVVITKYDHSRGQIGNLQIFEAGHPVPDENSYRATRAAMELVKPLGKDDTVLFLVSGGGSALFECPLIPEDEMADVTKQLLACGADIVEMNTIRKRLSGVKGGRFAELANPAKVFAIVLSDIIGDPLDMIASGPAYPDSSTCEDTARIAEKYGLRLSDSARALLQKETPKTLTNVETQITGSVRELCAAAEKEAAQLGYTCQLLTDCLCCQAREAGSFLASIAKTYAGTEKSLAFLAGGETVVKLTGKGLGGRNQELALAAAPGISGLKARTAPTVPPTQRAVWSTARRKESSARSASARRTCCRTTTRITRSKRSAASSSPAQPARMSTTLPWCSFAGNFVRMPFSTSRYAGERKECCLP